MKGIPKFIKTRSDLNNLFSLVQTGRVEKAELAEKINGLLELQYHHVPVMAVNGKTVTTRYFHEVNVGDTTKDGHIVKAIDHVQTPKSEDEGADAGISYEATKITLSNAPTDDAVLSIFKLDNYLTEKEFDHIAEDLKMVVDPGLVRFVFVDGNPVGFLAAVANINEIFIKLKGRLLPTGLFRILFGKSQIKSIRLMLLGVVKEYRQRGLEALMYYKSLQYAISKGYTTCENSWLLETNEPVQRASQFMGGREYRRYRIFDKTL